MSRFLVERIVKQTWLGCTFLVFAHDGFHHGLFILFSITFVSSLFIPLSDRRTVPAIDNAETFLWTLLLRLLSECARHLKNLVHALILRILDNWRFFIFFRNWNLNPRGAFDTRLLNHRHR